MIIINLIKELLTAGGVVMLPLGILSFTIWYMLVLRISKLSAHKFCRKKKIRQFGEALVNGQSLQESNASQQLCGIQLRLFEYLDHLPRYAWRKSFPSALTVPDGVVPSDGEGEYRGTPRSSEGANLPVQPTRRAGISCSVSSAWKTTILGSTYFRANETPSRTAPRTAEGLTPSVSQDRLKLAIDTAAHDCIQLVRSDHNLIRCLVNCAPLLGLLGTVWGMIETFDVISIIGTSEPGMLASGISKAMITTQAGLVVAVPAIIVEKRLSRWEDWISHKIEETGLVLIQCVDDVKP